MHYIPYRLNCDYMAQLSRRNKMLSPKLKGMEAIRAALKMAYDYAPRLLQTMECPIHAEEVHWLKGNRDVYFFEAAEQARGLMEGRFSITTDEALYSGPECFMLTIPRGLDFHPKLKGGGLLVTVMPHVDRTTTLFNPLMDFIGQPHHEVTVHGDMGRFTIMVNYQQDLTQRQLYNRLSLPSHIAVQCLLSNTFEEYEERINSMNEFDFTHGYSLSRTEMVYQYHMCRLLLGFMIYKKALPERIRPGLPGGAREKETTTPYVNRIVTHTIGSPRPQEKGKEYAPHYRRPHFRQLIDDRYYRGEHKTKPKGSRVIYVSDAFVGRKTESHTVI